MSLLRVVRSQYHLVPTARLKRSFLTMAPSAVSKQSTLGGFMKYPPGASRPPPQQSDIRSSMKKPDTNGSKAKAEASTSAGVPVKKEDRMEEDEVKDEDDSEEDLPRASSSARGKKRRVADSDTEEEEQATSAASKPSPAKAPKAEPAAPSSSASTLKTAKGKAAEGGKGSKKATAALDTASNVPTSAPSSSKPKVESKSASPGEESEDDAEASSSAGEEDKEDQKAHKSVAAFFMKPSEKKANGASSSSSSKKAEWEWEKGQPVPYAALAHSFSAIEATTKRLEIQALLSELLTKVIDRASKPEEVTQVVYLCINRLCPDYIGMELGLGEGLIVKALAQSFGREVSKIKKDLEQKGDLGLVALASRAKQPTMFAGKALTVPGVFSTLKEIATLSGNKSQERKLGLIKKLLAACKGEETKWIIRSLEGKLRIGLAERTVLVSLAQSAVNHRIGSKKHKMSAEDLSAELEKGTSLLKAVYSEMPNYDRIIPALIETGPEGLRKSCQLTPGIPLKPMLAKPTKAITEVLDRFEGKAFTCEYKYDGERAQVHFYVPGEAKAIEGDDAAPTTTVEAPGGSSGKKGKLGVFSRNSEDMSVKYPDLLESIPNFVKPSTKSFVLDAEVTAWKKAEMDEQGNVTDAGGLLPFQQLSTRKRKGVELDKIAVRVKLFAFDLLYVNGESLLHEDLATRRAKLREHFQPVENEFDFATSQDCNTVEEIQIFLDASVADRCEGLMVKMLQGEDAFYEPSRRSMNWLKLKKDYLSGTGDSLDLVVIGGYYGKGKRTHVYGAFLLGCWDADSESYQSVCKIGTGFSEANLEAFTAQLKPLELTVKKGYYDVGGATPDIFFEPKVVWEVLTADLSLSPVYTAAKGSVESRGISLRFPRFIRIRDDKDAEDSTTPEQIADMYRAQASAAKGSKGGGGGGEDEYW